MILDKLNEIIDAAEQAKIEVQDEEITACEGCGLFRSCLVCVNCDETNEICKLFQSRPPWRFVVYGCNNFEEKPEPIEELPPLPEGVIAGVPIPDDDIPF